MITLLTKYNSYIGREYASALIDAEINFVILAFGDHPPIEEMEEKRCAGIWTPISMSEIERARRVLRFRSTNELSCRRYLQAEELGLGIQGDVGKILDTGLIKQFQWGIINFHPGDLPMYRGCSAPEWQIYEEKPVVCTAHFLDEGIDTGDIIEKRILKLDYNSYHLMRASLYPAVAEFVVDLSKQYDTNQRFSSVSQGKGCYRQPMDDVALRHITERFDNARAKLVMTKFLPSSN